MNDKSGMRTFLRLSLRWNLSTRGGDDFLRISCWFSAAFLLKTTILDNNEITMIDVQAPACPGHADSAGL